MGEHPISPGPYVMGDTHTDTSHPIHTPGSITGPGPPLSPPRTTPWAGREGGTAISRAITHSLIPLAASPSSQKKRKITKKKKNHQKKEGSRAAARPESLQERAGSAEAPRRREQGACRGILLAQQSDPGCWVFPPPTLLCWKTSPRAGAEELGVGF